MAVAAPPQRASVCGRYGTVSDSATASVVSMSVGDENDDDDDEQHDDDGRRRERDGRGAADDLLVDLTRGVGGPFEIAGVHRVNGCDRAVDVEPEAACHF